MFKCFAPEGQELQRRPSLRRRISHRIRNARSLKRRSERNLDTSQGDDFPTWNYSEMDQVQRQADVRNWLHTFGLSQFEDYLIDATVQTIRMGLGWDKGADVDASVALFDEHLRVVDTVWYKKLRSTCRSVSHSGDNLTGVGEGDDEVITVELSEVPFHVHHLLFVVCVFSYDVSFRQIRSAYVRMMHGEEKYKRREMCRYSLTDMSGHAMVMGVLTRKGPYWNFRALGTQATGRNVLELLRNPRNLDFFSEVSSYNPELRHVAINVLRGTGLAAKDVSGLFRRNASSDPYFIIRFNRKQYTSEYRSQTLEPEWKAPPFQLGWITEVESKPLEIQIFDYDALSADDFMGMVQVPGHALFNLGPGDHIFWFELQTSKERAYRHEQVSGSILVSFAIDGSTTHLQGL